MSDFQSPCAALWDERAYVDGYDAISFALLEVIGVVRVGREFTLWVRNLRLFLFVLMISPFVLIYVLAFLVLFWLYKGLRILAVIAIRILWPIVSFISLVWLRFLGLYECIWDDGKCIFWFLKLITFILWLSFWIKIYIFHQIKVFWALSKLGFFKLLFFSITAILILIIRVFVTTFLSKLIFSSLILLRKLLLLAPLITRAWFNLIHFCGRTNPLLTIDKLIKADIVNLQFIAFRFA